MKVKEKEVKRLERKGWKIKMGDALVEDDKKGRTEKRKREKILNKQTNKEIIKEWVNMEEKRIRKENIERKTKKVRMRKKERK